jgi:hypothetical protein
MWSKINTKAIKAGCDSNFPKVPDGYLPLALAVAGGAPRATRKVGQTCCIGYGMPPGEASNDSSPDYPYEDMLKAIEARVEALALEGLRDRYLDLAVFPRTSPS